MAEDDEVESYIEKIVEKKFKKLGAGNIFSEGENKPPSHLKELIGEIKVVKELGDATRGDFDKIIAEGIKQKMAETIVPALFGVQQKTSFWESGSMQQFFRGLGESAPQHIAGILDSLTKNFGKDGAERVISGFGSIGGKSGGKSGGGTGDGIGGEAGKDDEVVRSLDPDNPSHLHYYMSIRNMGSADVITAKRALFLEKENLTKRTRSGGSGPSSADSGDIGSGPGGLGGLGSGPGYGTVPGNYDTKNYDGADRNVAIENIIADQNAYLKKLVEKQNQSDEIIKYLIEKVEKIEKKGSTGSVRSDGIGGVGVGGESVGGESVGGESVGVSGVGSNDYELKNKSDEEVIASLSERWAPKIVDNVKKEEIEKGGNDEVIEKGGNIEVVEKDFEIAETKKSDTFEENILKERGKKVEEEKVAVVGVRMKNKTEPVFDDE